MAIWGMTSTLNGDDVRYYLNPLCLCQPSPCLLPLLLLLLPAPAVLALTDRLCIDLKTLCLLPCLLSRLWMIPTLSAASNSTVLNGFMALEFGTTTVMSLSRTGVINESTNRTAWRSVKEEKKETSQTTITTITERQFLPGRKNTPQDSAGKKRRRKERRAKEDKEEEEKKEAMRQDRLFYSRNKHRGNRETQKDNLILQQDAHAHGAWIPGWRQG